MISSTANATTQPPVPAQRPQPAGARREREQQQGADRRAREDDRRRADLPRGDLDEELPRAPDQPEGTAQQPTATAHASLAAARGFTGTAQP